MASPFHDFIPRSTATNLAVNNSACPPDSSVTLKLTVASPASKLLNAMWRSDNTTHFISIRDPKTDSFRNQPVANIHVAVQQANEYSCRGMDVYFACAEYKSAESRKKENVDGAYGFWIDIDCGDDKVTSGRGYRTIEEAELALSALCVTAQLPTPTLIVLSGGGLHCYWALTTRLGALLWKAMATKLKELAKALGFWPDPSRTDDIASVMRVPGTNNYKTGQPRPVKLKLSSNQYIEREAMLDAINCAHEQFCNSTKSLPSDASIAVGEVYNPPDMNRLTSALKVLDPDCEDRIWKFHRLGPLAELARTHPDQAKALHELARDWSSGALAGKPSLAWHTPGQSISKTGEEIFESVWQRLLTSSYGGQRPGVGTIYHDAKAAGWTPPNLTPTETVVIAPAAPGVNYLRSVQQQFSLANIEGKVWLLDEAQLSRSSAEGLAAKLVLSNRSDGMLLIKRLLSRLGANEEQVTRLAGEFFTSPLTVCYSGIEFNPIPTNENFLNLWVAPTLIPQAGGWTLIRSFMLEILCDSHQAAFNYLLCFLAHALQHPEDKPGVFIIMIGGQGVGKGTLGKILRKLWSATFLLLHRIDDVTGNFNAALERSFIVFLDEALFVGDRKASDALKSLITEPIIQVNEKYQPARQTRSFHRFFAATNADHFKNTERDDRRDFVLRVSEARKGDHAYWSALNAEIEQGSVAAMMHDLLAMDLSSFNVRDKPSTKALMDQKLHSLNPIERWWYEALMAGSIDGETWPNFLPTGTAIDNIMEMAGGRVYRKPAPIDVVQSIKRMCPCASNAQRSDGFSRQRGLDLPALAEARTEFESYLGGAVPWEF